MSSTQDSLQWSGGRDATDPPAVFHLHTWCLLTGAGALCPGPGPWVLASAQSVSPKSSLLLLCVGSRAARLEWEYKTGRGLGAAKGAYYVPGSFARQRMYIILLTPVSASPCCQDGTEAWKFSVLPEMTQPAGAGLGLEPGSTHSGSWGSGWTRGLRVSPGSLPCQM